MMGEMVCLNGRIVPAESARVSVFDGGFAHSAGLFETMRAYEGRVMRLREHVDRLNRSASTLQMPIVLDADDVRSRVMELLEANELRDARIRVTATVGSIPRPGADAATQADSTWLITANAVQAYPSDLYQHGMRVCICPYNQNSADPLAGHKTLAYLPRLMALRGAAEKKCHEALWFTSDHRLAEGSVCNVFVVREGVILTPPADTPILPGTVRQAVIEIAAAGGMELSECAIDIDALLSSDEVFLTGSVLEIMPATAIEKHQVGSGVPGAITRRVAKLYSELVARECAVE